MEERTNQLISTEYVSDEYLHLNSCGVQYLNKDASSLRKKGRRDYHILYIHQGRCHAEINSAEAIVNEGNLILYKPGQKQKYAFRAEDNSVSCYLHFTGTECEELISRIGLTENQVVYVGKSHRIKSIFEKMSKEYILKKPCYNELCTAYLLEFFSVAARKISYHAFPGKAEKNSVIDEVCLLMHSSYDKNRPLKYYADFCNLSVSRFSHLFKEYTGLTAFEYIMKIRIDKAKEYLTETDLPVSRISELVGFSDQNYFGRAFKRYTGIAPKKYSKLFS